jgi:hypothetical protein
MTVIELILFLPARECTLKVQAEQMLNATMKDQLKPEPWRCFDDIECDMKRRKFVFSTAYFNECTSVKCRAE